MQICKKCGSEIRGDVCENCTRAEGVYIFNDVISGPINLKEHWFYRQFFPHYDETTLFVMGIISIFIFFTHQQALEFVLNETNKSFIFFVYFLIFSFSIFLMIFHAFIKRKKYKFEKKLMIKSAVLMNFVSGMLASSAAIENSIGFLVIFPAINIINSFILIILAKFEIINEMNISDKNANIYEVLISAILASIVFAISTYYYDHKWFISFSMCVVYATNFNIPILMLIEKGLKIDLGTSKRCGVSP